MSFGDLKISEKLVPKNYMSLGVAAQRSKQRAFKELLEERKWPEHGWPDEHIEELVHQVAGLDSNNFGHNVGMGEREARIACKLVARRHYNFGHGIGRSGDLLEAQPKAAGSTLLANLTNSLLQQLIQMLGIRSCRCCFLVPVATGMTLTLCFQSLRKSRPLAKYVLWSRIDQKSCFKAITAAGLQPIIIAGTLLPEEKALITNVAAFEQQLAQLDPAQILCLYTTTSCFAPRNSDDIVAIAKLAANAGVPHVINNAYGLQCSKLTHQLEQAQRVGRVDYFVQSTDKNLMVPVGGAIVASFDEQSLQQVASTYAGRASSSQTLDVFMTLLSLGRDGYLRLVSERKQNFLYLRERLQEFAATHGERVPDTKMNGISLALTLETLSAIGITSLGAMLHTRGVSGVRVVPMGVNKSIDGYEFANFGAHHEDYKQPYLTVAAALGVTRPEIDKFFTVLDRCWTEYKKMKATSLDLSSTK
ncbi:O-phosphoseryl-tRNA(Sec) selenium transferase [Scaptodrosophila lebanonensis]|uniref:O-phosphoseryl-tRNA(Sec) selenium transferase n=1 Tax=Drosophila lebanonensis TaxID=7225 RepID=A0A6J2TEV6_DROLE|nr:O-phosphoseryl-tRNA(Sec) selenium transferase [Scaptodrosophila lebanonensis]